MDHLETREKLLLRLLFDDVPFEEKHIEILLPEPAIDRERLEYLLMLSILGTRRHWQYFPAWVQPRLRGIYRYFRVENIKGVPWLKEKLRLLEEQGIPVLLLKGIAMRMHYAADSPRQMDDFDIAVPADLFEKACRVMLDSGCSESAEGPALHARTFCEGDDFSLDLHQWIFKTHGDKDADVWEKAEPAVFQDRNVLVMQPADMAIHILDSQARDVIKDNTMERRMKWLFDVRSVIGAADGFSWEKIADRAKELGTLSYLTMILPVFSEVFPEKLGADELNAYFPRDGAYQSWASGMETYRRESEQYHEAMAEHEDRLYSPYMALRKLRHLWTGWRCYYKPELREAGVRMNFIQYVCFMQETGSPAELFRKYLPVMFGPDRS